MALQTIVWTCVIVFVLTSLITLLGITNVLKIEKSYLNALFGALILEIVSISVIVFTNNMRDESRMSYVRLTFPVSDVSVGSDTFQSISGIGLLSSDAQRLTCRAFTQNDTTPFSTRTFTTRDYFSFRHNLAGVTLPAELGIRCSIMEGEKVITGDSIDITLNR
jgi:hypothetical protein